MANVKESIKSGLGRAWYWTHGWFINRGYNIRNWWQLNPQKRGLAATALVFLISNAVVASMLGGYAYAYQQSVTSYSLDLGFTTTYNDTSTMQYVHVVISNSTYTTYRKMNHDIIAPYDLGQYEAFCKADFLYPIADHIRSSLGGGASDEAIIAAVLSFVQDKYNGARGLHYNYDPPYEEYPRYPVETLVDRGGDCEDVAILFTSLVLTLGYKAILITVPGHMFAGVSIPQAPAHNTGPIYYYTLGGVRYYACECTAYGWFVGCTLTEIADLLASWKVVEVTI